MPNNSNNKKSSSNSNRNNNIVTKITKSVKKMDTTTILLLVVVVIVIYLVFFDGKKMNIRLFNHRHQQGNEGFNNNSLAEKGKTVLVLFHAEWCGYCKKFMPTWNKAKSSLQSSDVVLKDYEADTDKEVMKENNVSSYPTLKLFKKDRGASDDS